MNHQWPHVVYLESSFVTSLVLLAIKRCYLRKRILDSLLKARQEKKDLSFGEGTVILCKCAMQVHLGVYFYSVTNPTAPKTFINCSYSGSLNTQKNTFVMYSS